MSEFSGGADWAVTMTKFKAASSTRRVTITERQSVYGRLEFFVRAFASLRTAGRLLLRPTPWCACMTFSYVHSEKSNCYRLQSVTKTTRQLCYPTQVGSYEQRRTSERREESPSPRAAQMYLSYSPLRVSTRYDSFQFSFATLVRADKS